MLFYLIFFPIAIASLGWSLFNGSSDLWVVTAIFTFLYSGYGISVGFHRLLSHGAFETSEIIRKLLLFWGCQGAQGSPVTWSLIHNRSHHAYTDTDKDVHTPTKGISYALGGWIFHKENHEFAQKELFKIRKQLDPFALWCHKNYNVLIILNLVVIALLSGYMFGGRYVLASLNASMLSVVISGIVNWLGHYPIKGLTYTDYKLNNKSTNNPWAVFLTWGESLHNNHHANPRRLSFATRWYELDVGLWMINLIKKS